MANVMEFPDTVEEFMNLYKVVDSDYVYSNGVEFVPIYRMKQWFEHLRLKTNADCIRSMSNEELAKFIDHAANPPEVHCIDCKWDFCWKCWLEWLEKEVTNEDEYEWRELEDVQQL